MIHFLTFIIDFHFTKCLDDVATFKKYLISFKLLHFPTILKILEVYNLSLVFQLLLGPQDLYLPDNSLNKNLI